ncbi:MAG: HYR domain-containing protein [Nitrospira sp.]|nr:HYR domain-containing protein [Nitrospira sp.]
MSAQPVSDANSMTEKGSNATSISIPTFSVPANNDRLLVAYTVTSANATPPAITFGSNSMTLGQNKNSGGLVVSMYYLVLGSSASPTTDAITATGTNMYYLAATSFHNVDQSDPTDGETSTSISGTTILSTLTVNSSPTGLVCDAFGYYASSGATDITEGMGQTLLFKRADSSPLLFRLGSSTKAGASPSVTMNWTVVGTPSGGLGSHVGMNLRGVSTCPPTGTVWYVDASATPGGNGASWGCAFQNLQDAINAASSGHEVWVKAGIYKPTAYPNGCSGCSTDRDFAFHLKNGVAVYGGFAGTETLRSDRNWTTNLTTLSGNIGDANDATDNCYHVVLSVSDANTTVLDGFTIADAYADGTGSITVESNNISKVYGGGMFNRSSSPKVNNCTFSGNTITNSSGLGAGMYALLGSPAVSSCLFLGNSNVNSGGGVYNQQVTNATFDDCTFSNNTALYGGGAFNTISTLTFSGCTFLSNIASNSGGGMRNESSTSVTVIDGVFAGNSTSSSNGGGFYIGTSSTSAVLTNCLIAGNSASGTGGGIYNSGTPTVTITNCTISGNQAGSTTGGGVHFAASNPTMTNCVIWNNRANGVTGSSGASLSLLSSTPVINYSLIQNLNPSGTGNLNGIPDAANSNYPHFLTLLDPATAPGTGGDFQVLSCSPLINAGDDTAVPMGVNTDLGGDPRFYNSGTVDIGAYEYQGVYTVPAAPMGTLAITNSTCSACTVSGGSIAIGSVTGSGGTLQYSTNNGATWSSTLPTYNQTGPSQTILASVLAPDGCRSNSTQVGQTTPGTCTTPDAPTGSLAITNSTCSACTVSGGSIAIGTVSGSGGTLEYSTDNGATWSSTLPTYNQTGPAQTILASVLSANGCRSNSTQVGQTTPGTCTTPGAPMGSLAITNSTCSACTVSGGSIAIGSVSGSGGTLEYSTDNGATWSSTLPTYNQTGPAQTILASILSSNGCRSNSTQVGMTVPGTCTTPSAPTGTLAITNSTCSACTVSGGSIAIGSVNGSGGTLEYSTDNGATWSSTLPTYNQTGPAQTILASVLAPDGCRSNSTLVGETMPGTCSGPTAPTGTLAIINSTCSACTVSGGSIAIGSVSGSGGTLEYSTDNGATWSSTLPTYNQTGPAQTILASILSSNGCRSNSTQVGQTTPGTCTTPSAPTGTLAIINSTCSACTVSGGSIAIGSVSGSGGTLEYSTDNGATWSSTLPTYNQTGPAQTILASVMAPDGCRSNSTQVGVTVPGTCTTPGAPISNTNGLALNCNNPQTTLSVPAASSYNWTRNGNPFGSNQSVLATEAGTYAVTITATNGCTASSSVVVTYTPDTTPPMVVCNNYTAVLNSSGQASITTANVFQSGSDNCGTVNQQGVSPNTFSCSNLGANQVTLTVNDGNGNTNTCQATVTVQDNTPPTVVCKNHTVALNASGQASISTANVFQSGADNCGTVNQQGVSPNSFNCSNLGPNQVTLTVNDGNGNTNTCTATVTVQDNTPPTVTCKSATLSLGANGTVVLSPAQVFQSGTDNCGTVNLALVAPSLFNCSDVGSNQVTLTVNDGHGNTATCQATVTVQDNTLPVAVCKNITVNLGANGMATITATQINNGSTDNCGLASLAASPTSFTCANLGANPVVLTAMDMNGNTNICQATVTVTDNLPPTVGCKNIVVQLDSTGFAAITAASVFTAAASSDNCGTVNPVSVSPNQFFCAQVGNNTVTLTANDGHGNTATCQATVTVSPYFVTPDIIVTPENCGQGNGSIVISLPGATGQVGYSVDGGATFQFDGTFNNLTSGNYLVVVQTFGPYSCGILQVTTTLPQLSVANTWTGGGDGLHWSDAANWSLNMVPDPCHDVIIPPGANVLVAAGVHARGRTLDVQLGSVLTMAPSAVMDIVKP